VNRKLWCDMTFREFTDDAARYLLDGFIVGGAKELKSRLREALLDASQTPIDSRPKSDDND
jgi:hypothetical protein